MIGLDISYVYPINYLGDVGTAITFDPDISFGYSMPWKNDEEFITVHFIPYF